MPIGTMSGSAAPITPATWNITFQPRPTLYATVLQPAGATVWPAVIKAARES